MVSCLMVTKDRGPLARLNVEAFLRQSWKYKELVIIDDSAKPINLELARNVRQIFVDPAIGMGEKHNVALKHAEGDLIAYWDDDDIYREHRLTYQLGPILNDRADMTGLKRDYILKLPAGTWHQFNNAHLKAADWLGNGKGISRVKYHDGTAMFRRDKINGTVHPNWLVSQKLAFLSGMIERGARTVTLPNADTFVYVRHETNTWQFREDLRLEDRPAPAWVLPSLVDAYRKANAA